MDHLVGTIEPGKKADIILYDKDPLQFPETFQEREHLVFIMQDGDIFKNTL